MSDYYEELQYFQGQGFMVGVQINPVSGLPSGFPVMLSTSISIYTHNIRLVFDLRRDGWGLP